MLPPRKPKSTVLDLQGHFLIYLQAPQFSCCKQHALLYRETKCRNIYTSGSQIKQKYMSRLFITQSNLIMLHREPSENRLMRGGWVWNWQTGSKVLFLSTDFRLIVGASAAGRPPWPRHRPARPEMENIPGGDSHIFLCVGWWRWGKGWGLGCSKKVRWGWPLTTSSMAFPNAEWLLQQSPLC